MHKRLLLTLPITAALALVGCNPSSNSANSTTGASGEQTNGSGSDSDNSSSLTVFTDLNWEISADNFQDLSLVRGSADLLAIKRKGRTGNDDYTLLTSTEPSKELTVHQSLSVNDYYSSQVRTVGFKFENSTAQEEVMVVTCTPGDAFEDTTYANIIPATLSFSLKSDPTVIETVNLNTINSSFNNIITCDAMDVYYSAATPGELILFIGGRHGYVDLTGMRPMLSNRTAISRLAINFNKDGELSDNSPVVDEMIAFNKIEGELLDDIKATYQILALSALSSDDVLYYEVRSNNNYLWLFEYGKTNPSIIVSSKTNAFTGIEENMTISDMQAHTSFGNIKQVSLVSHDHVGTITVDYESTAPAFTLSTNDDAKTCVDVITADAADYATLWCHNSEDTGKLIEFNY